MALIADDRRNLARDALAGLDRLLDAVPPDTPLPGRELAALVRLIRTAMDESRDRHPTVDQPHL